jgi:hypothetical protein
MLECGFKPEAIEFINYEGRGMVFNVFGLFNINNFEGKYTLGYQGYCDFCYIFWQAS